MIRKTELQLKQQQRTTETSTQGRGDGDGIVRRHASDRFRLDDREAAKQPYREMEDRRSSSNSREPNTRTSVILDSELASDQARFNPVYRWVLIKEELCGAVHTCRLVLHPDSNQH